MNRAMLAKNIVNGDELVVIPRREYDKFLAVYEKFVWDEKERAADEDIRKGRLSPSYKTGKELRAALNKLKR